MSQPLSDKQRKQIHDLALEARELLEGLYGWADRPAGETAPGAEGSGGQSVDQTFFTGEATKGLRQDIRIRAAIETLAHCGPALFDVGNPGTLKTTAFALRKEPDAEARANSVGTYFRLVHEDSGDAKRRAFEQALAALREKPLQ